jgi:hypothetical protein
MKNIFTENIDKYGIINLIIWVSIPVIIALMVLAPSSFNDSSNNSSSTSSFTNKYGSSTTKCAHTGCTRYIASSGDTNCCTVHSNKCGNCGKYIDEDAMYCMDCIEKALNKN